MWLQSLEPPNLAYKILIRSGMHQLDFFVLHTHQLDSFVRSKILIEEFSLLFSNVTFFEKYSTIDC